MPDSACREVERFKSTLPHTGSEMFSWNRPIVQARISQLLYKALSYLVRSVARSTVIFGIAGGVSSFAADARADVCDDALDRYNSATDRLNSTNAVPQDTCKARDFFQSKEGEVQQIFSLNIAVEAACSAIEHKGNGIPVADLLAEVKSKLQTWTQRCQEYTAQQQRMTAPSAAAGPAPDPTATRTAADLNRQQLGQAGPSATAAKAAGTAASSSQPGCSDLTGTGGPPIKCPERRPAGIPGSPSAQVKPASATPSATQPGATYPGGFAALEDPATAFARSFFGGPPPAPNSDPEVRAQAIYAQAQQALDAHNCAAAADLFAGALAASVRDKSTYADWQARAANGSLAAMRAAGRDRGSAAAARQIDVRSQSRE